MRKVIGLTLLWDDKRESSWVLPGQMKLIRQSGGPPMMLPMTDGKDRLVQAPALSLRDRMGSYLLHIAPGKAMPLPGFCRGIQLMDLCPGGTQRRTF